jgi:Kef-type K+ transport system membrane component KefB/nucleotide-binding universal stress UspA family protein
MERAIRSWRILSAAGALRRAALRRRPSGRRRFVLPGGLAILLLAGGTAFAAAGPGAGEAPAQPSEALLLAQVVVLVILGRLLGELMYRLGQPTIIGQIVAGILLGPTVFGNLMPMAQAMLFPKSPEQAAMLNGVSQLGILFLLLLAGMETDLGLAWRLRKAAASVSLAGIAVPFVLGITVGMLVPAELLPDPDKRVVTALFLGTALSISSLKIVATVVREMNFMRRNIGQLIVGSAVIDDTAGWVIIGITLSLATAGHIDLRTLGLAVIGTAVFLVLSFTVGRRIVFEIIRWTNDSLKSDLPVTTAIVGLMGILALITAGIGVQTVLGAFVAGVLIGDSPILTRRIDEQLRGLTTALFMPVFFGLTGLHADLRVLADPDTLALTIGVILIASVGKFGGAFLGAWLNRMSRAEALALGFGMNARGSTEVIVASIGLSVGVLDQRLFSVIVTMAIVTTLIMPPTLRWALARLPLRADEESRLKREEFEEESFVSKLERILLAVDRSDAGRLAAVLAGHLSGLRNMPVTVLNLAEEKAAEEAPPDGAAAAEDDSTAAEDTVERVRESAVEGIAAAQESDQMRPSASLVGVHVEAKDVVEAIAAEGDKGHDLMFLGTEPLVADEGGFAARVEPMFSAFRQTTAIISARGDLRRDPEARLRILVPVTGDALSMRAIELAVLLAKASQARVTALYVRPERRQSSREAARAEVEQPAHLAVFDHIKTIGQHYEIDIRTIAPESATPELSILSHARRGRHNLILLGVGRRAGEKLSFGAIASTLLETSDRSLVFFASG